MKSESSMLYSTLKKVKSESVEEILFGNTQILWATSVFIKQQVISKIVRLVLTKFLCG